MLFNWGYQKGKKRIKGFPPVMLYYPHNQKKEDKQMRLKGMMLGVALMVGVGASVVGGSRVEAKAKSKTPVYKVTSKKQIKKVQKKVYVRYKKNLPTKLRGKYKYGVASYIRSKEMKANKIHYVRGLNTSTLSSKKSIKAFRRELKYLTLLIRDMDKVYAKALSMREKTYENEIWDGITIVGSETKHYYEGVSDSEIKATVLCEYLEHLQTAEQGYGKDNPKGFEKTYKGIYKGNCHYETEVTVAIAKAWGFKVKHCVSIKRNHEWIGIYQTDLKGVTYCSSDVKNKGCSTLDGETRSYIKKLQGSHTALTKEQFETEFLGIE